MKTVLALGNPTEKYRMTRHNIGYLVADRLAERAGTVWKLRDNLLLAEFGAWRLVKPLTWMNCSGEVLPALGGSFAPEELLVVADEVNLPLGRLRLRAGGSGGGHNGLASVELALGRNDYHRLRVGVGGEKPVPGAELVAFVLGEFPEEQRPLLALVVEEAVRAVESWLTAGMPAAQERHNGCDLRARGPETAGAAQAGGAGGE